ncbi:MAG TPA: lytic transglycosylase domain-containing protein [Longimicrobium sp.]|nr:lytic transglycosylase domain-containing protein [Longimicrobium sp.]
MKFTRTRHMDSRRDFERLRGETTSLLRSRAVQSMLITTAVLQTISVVGDKHQQQPAKESSVKPTAFAQPLPPVSAQYIRRAEADLKAAAPKAEVAAEKPSEEAAEATELAAEYRAKGYKVPDTLAEQIVEAATESGIEPDVAFGLVATESGFQRKARSHVGAIGLAQLMPATARWLEPGTTRKDLENPETNLRLGLRYLSSLIEKYDGDTELALTAYNRGPGTVDRVLRRGGDPDNGYAGKVLGSE